MASDDKSGLAVGALRSFTVAEGILLLVLGVLALIFPMIASAWVTVVVALAFLVGGIIGWVNSLNRSRQLSKWHCFWRLVVSTLFVVTGAWIIQQFSAGVEPAAAQVAALAFAIGIVFLVEGVVASIVSLSHTELAGWAWGLSYGIVSLLLGLIIVSMKCPGLLSGLGSPAGISVPLRGIDLLVFSAASLVSGDR